MMPPEFIYIFLATGLLLAALGYFHVAEHWGIVDRPNERSSHAVPTIRGGGILFPLSWLCWSAYDGWSLPWLTSGVVLLALMGFLDDRKGLRAGIRLVIQIAAFVLLWIELMGADHWSWWLLPTAIVGIGAVNAVNFMDGINGMTGLYALSILLPMQIFYAPAWWTPTPWSFLVIGILVFGWFNFRRKARCFAGDVGSVSLGYLLVFYVLTIFLDRKPLDPTQDQGLDIRVSAILMMALYGVDSVLTILQRLWLKENIFQAHRRHLYQVLANERGMAHLWVAGIYASLQGAINIWSLSTEFGLLSSILLLLAMVVFYLVVKFPIKFSISR